MKKLAFLSAAALAAAFSAQALAAPPATTTSKPHVASTSKPAKVVEKTAKGVVDTWSADTRMLALKGGDSFKVADSVKKTDFAAGAKVTVHYTDKDGAKVADRVSVAAAKPKAKKS